MNRLNMMKPFYVLLGLVPVIARFVVWIISNSGVDVLAISDLVAFLDLPVRRYLAIAARIEETAEARV